MKNEELQKNLAANSRRLRESRGLSQQGLANLAAIPRPTLTSLESGRANPTLSVLNKVALALQVSIEELIGSPRSEVQHFRAAEIKSERHGGAQVRPLVPESLSGLELSRMELRGGGTMKGVPHTVGTREYLTCETGQVRLNVSGRSWILEPGDMLVFRGDQHHSYQNPDPVDSAVAISVVCFAKS